MCRLQSLLVLIALATAPVSASQAEDTWPTRPVKLVVGFTAGGSNDLQARVIAQKLTEQLGQPVIVENRPGAGGNIAAEMVAGAPADGYTLLMAPTSTLVINPAVYSKTPYDPLQSFTHIIELSRFQFFLAINSSHQARTVQELIAFGKAKPELANYGSSAIVFQLLSELFNKQAAVRFVRIPFKSGADMVTALLSGQATMAFNDLPPMVGHLQDGSLRVLASTGRARAAELPDVPTMAETGFAEIVAEGFSGVIGPRNLPLDVVMRLQKEIHGALSTSSVRAAFQSLGITPAGGKSEDFRDMLVREIPRWRRIVKDTGVQFD